MKVVLASDHAGFDMKNALVARVADLGHEAVDLGTYAADSVSYADYGRLAAEAVARGQADRAILVCGTGVGISLAANSVDGVRCVVCSEPFSAILSRNHNDTNALAMGARVLGIPNAEMIAEQWLAAQFEGGRHQLRVDQVNEFKLDGACG